MTNKKATKRALTLSIISMLICVVMLAGTTFAWFTDSVTSGVNQIVAGNLDVDVVTADGNSIADKTELFDVDLWEPGVVAYENLTVKNLGTLALKYDLTVNFENENFVKDTTYGLSSAIKVGVVDGAVSGTREEVVAKVADWTSLNNFVESGVLLEKDAKRTYAIVLYWEPSADDNNWNLNNGKVTDDGADALHIDLGVKLVATQVEHEFDSFGNDYDANAAFSVWDGTVPTVMPETLVVDGAKQTVYVKDAAAFAYLSTLSDKWVELYTDGNGTTYTNYANGAGANYYYSGNWSVSLEADIDLANHAIDPVDIKFGQSTGATAFNGNGHTIRNINATTGLFADATRASFANLVLDNVKATKGALIGIANHSITNVTVKNASISGADYVGGLAGRLFSSVKNCKVLDSSVIATGKEAGGLIGYAETNSKGSTIANNTVKNVSVYANNRAAGLVAQVNVNINVYNNTVDTVTVGAEDTSTYQPGAVVSNALAPANVYDNTVKNADVTTAIVIASNDDGLDNAIKNGAETLVLAAGNYVIPDSAQGKELKIIGNGETVIATQDDGSYEGCDYSLDGAKVDFENVVINTDSSTYTGYARCSATYTNCTINGAYTLYGESTFNNCTFNVTGDTYNIWTWGGKTVKFNGCTFNTDGKSILVYNQSCDVYVDGCTFNDRTNGTYFTKSALETGVDNVGPKYNIYINNTTFNGFAENDKCVGYKNIVGNKNSITSEYLNIVVDGVDVY